jgi:pilus assembly protein CpaB
MLLLVVGLAVLITVVVTGNLSEVQRQAAEREAALKALYESKSKVVLATRDIPQGEPVTADAIEEKQELVSKIPMGAITNSTAIVGRIAKFPIASGQIVSDHDLVGAALASGLESVLKPGFEAVTLAVDPDTGIAGFIRPGSHVDIYATAGSESKTKAGAILSDCNVVAVDKDYGEQAAEEKHNADKNQQNPGSPSAGGGISGPSSNGGGIESTKHITLQLEPKNIQRLLKGVQS